MDIEVYTGTRRVPHDVRTAGDRYRDGFWSAGFGAARPVRELAGDSLGRFFEEGRRRIRESA